MGRPSIPPSLMMRAVLFQIRDDVGDREAARRAAKDLDWKRALRLEADDVPFHHTRLSVFRSRLLVNDADEAVLLATIRAGGCSRPVRQEGAGHRRLDWGDGRGGGWLTPMS